MIVSKRPSTAAHANGRSHVPKIPIPKTFTHTTLQHGIRVRPSAYEPAQVPHARHSASQAVPLASLGTSHAATLRKHAA